MNDIILAFPLFSIICCFVGAILCSFIKPKLSFYIQCAVDVIVCSLSIIILSYCLKNDSSYIYTMGHYGPNEDSIRICNEIRFGPLEGFLCAFFSIILLLSNVGGKVFQLIEIDHKKLNLYYVLLNLILVSNISLAYTNDIFTGYVFIEISTLASCGCLMVKQQGATILSAVRYMIFNLVGSGLFLIGIVIMYDITGYLSIENIAMAIKEFGSELPPSCIVSFALITLGLAIKSGLFPFHFWMPDAYGLATATSSSLLSGMVTKGYIILLIKVIYRMFTYQVIVQTGLLNILLVLGVLGMIIGSINAINQTSIDRMIAFSSAAQIGYIFMGIGMGEKIAIIAALYHILTHAITKPLLFLAENKLSEVCNGSEKFKHLRGSGRKDIISGVCFSVGAFSMVGIPLFAGFISKYLFVDAALANSTSLVITIICCFALLVSTVLNAIYFIRTMITLYLYPIGPEFITNQKVKYKPSYVIGTCGLAILNVALAFASTFICDILSKGFDLFI